MTYRDPLTKKFAQRPDPRFIARRTSEAKISRRIDKMLAAIQNDQLRRHNAAMNGYRGVLTRAELAYQMGV